MHPEETTTNQLGLGDDEHASGASSSMRASPIPPQQSIDIHVAEDSTTSDEQQKPAVGASIADVAAVDISEPATCAEPTNHEFENSKGCQVRHPGKLYYPTGEGRFQKQTKA